MVFPLDVMLILKGNLNYKWPGGVVTNLLKAKNIYKILDCNTDIIDHVNVVWYSSYDVDAWKKIL